MEIAKMLLENGQDPNIRFTKMKSSPLLLAVSYNHPDMVKLLLEYGADVYFVGEKKQNALDIAREKGFSEIEQLLLNPRVKYNIEQVKQINQIRLLQAVSRGQLQHVRTLLDQGADINVKEKKTGQIENNEEVEVANVEIHWTLQQTKDPKIKNLLAAVALGDINKVNNLLNKEIINKKIYSLNDGTVLSWAAYCNQPRLVKWLIERGANVDARSNHNLTPLIEAAHLGHLEVVKILIQNGADVNAATKKGWTALMWSGKNGRLEVVRFLLQSGADKTPKNHRGKTAVEIA